MSMPEDKTLKEDCVWSKERKEHSISENSNLILIEAEEDLGFHIFFWPALGSDPTSHLIQDLITVSQLASKTIYLQTFANPLCLFMLFCTRVKKKVWGVTH